MTVKVIYGCFVIMFLVLISSCSQKINAHFWQEEIEILQNKLANQKDVKLDIAAAKMLVEKSRTYAQQFPQDTLAPIYLFRAADVSRGIGEYGLAIALWSKVKKKYPTFDKAGDALFMQSYTFENNLKDQKQARIYYELFLAEYPQHKLVPIVKLSLQNLEKSPEELIREFEKN